MDKFKKKINKKSISYQNLRVQKSQEWIPKKKEVLVAYSLIIIKQHLPSKYWKLMLNHLQRKKSLENKNHLFVKIKKRNYKEIRIYQVHASKEIRKACLKKNNENETSITSLPFFIKSYVPKNRSTSCIKECVNLKVKKKKFRY